MINFSRFISEAGKKLDTFDEVSLYEIITKSKQIKKYLLTLVGDRRMFVDELQNIAKKHKFEIEDYNKLYIRFVDRNKTYQDDLD